jgi:chemotaxis regulatin CheY-phosphate phosphatase CheZ
VVETAGAAALGVELQTSLDLLHRLFLEVESGGPAVNQDLQVRLAVDAVRRRPNLAKLPDLLLRVYGDLAVALSGIRVTRETIQMHSMERLRNTHAKLNEVSSATETAATEMLNGLDRTLGMIDQLEGATRDNRRPSHEMCDALRMEVNQLYGCLQFQDIITQQLSGVAALLIEIEQRLESVAQLFDDPPATDPAAELAAEPHPDPTAFNPDATMRDAAGRQAMIDDTIRSTRSSGSPSS